MAVNHVILKEFHHERETPYFLNYLKRYTDTPFLVRLEQSTAGGQANGTENNSDPMVYSAGRLLRANKISRYAQEENGDWKFLVFDSLSNEPRMPGGSAGHRWDKTEGKWNLEPKDPTDGSLLRAAIVFHRQSLAVR